MAEQRVKKPVGTAFDRYAHQYDDYASVQKTVAQRLDRLVGQAVSTDPHAILDIGCGTGAMLAAQQIRFPSARLSGIDLSLNMLRHTARRSPAWLLVNADAEALPFQDKSFDLVVSASTLQWVARLEESLRECRRVMKPGGTFCAALFGGSTLHELQRSYRQAVAARFGGSDRRVERLHRFRTMEEIRSAADRAGFEEVLVTGEKHVQWYRDVRQVLESVKGIGAGTPNGNGAGGLGWRRTLKEMEEVYSSLFRQEGLLPVTYEVYYLTGRKVS